MRSRHLRLLISLFLLLAAYPYATGVVADVFVQLLLTLVLIHIIDAAGSKKARLIAGGLALPALLFPWLMRGESGLLLSGLGAWTALHLFALSVLLRNVLRPGPADLDRVCGVLCGYLLLGLLFTGVHLMVWMTDQSAYNSITAETLDAAVPNFLYFSFVTVTTLGYGDITPASDVARSIAALEATTGTLYVAVLIARLVGSYMPTARSRNGN